MIIIIGLGNPGKKFEQTRHNVGFMAVDAFAKKNNFPEFKLEKKPNALISEKDEVLLVKPQTFMNESGRAARLLIKNSKTEKFKNYIAVIHDDVDLPVGKMKIVHERGSAGHKGVESIIKSIGNAGLVRFRIGIGSEAKTEALNIVLKKFSAQEQNEINEVIKKTTDALSVFIEEGLDKAMNKFNS